MKTEIYNKIGEIAIQLIKEEDYYTRAVLSEELNVIFNSSKFDDGVNITRIVNEAYDFFKGNREVKSAIEHAFRDNAEHHNLIGSQIATTEFVLFNINSSLGDSINNTQNKIDLFRDKSYLSDQAQNDIINISNTVNNYIAETGFFNKLTGASKIEKIQKVGVNLYEQYTELVDTYEDTKLNIEISIEDYVVIRSQVFSAYKQVILQLKEVFGNKITSIDPELFDYSRINWLDTSDLKNELKSKYDELNEKCTLLIGEINDKLLKNTNNILSRTLSNKSIKSSKSRGMIAFAQIGFELFNSHLNASEKAIELNKELELMKKMFRYDMNIFKSDLQRLNKINKTISGLFLPGTKVFFEQFEGIISPEVQSLFKVIDRVDGVSELKHNREKLLETSSSLSVEIDDHNESILYFKNKLNEANTQIELLEPRYVQFINTKPSKPLWLLNILSFGQLKRNYQNELLEWHNNSKGTLNTYNNNKDDIDYYSSHISIHKINLIEKQKKLQKVENEIKKITGDIFSKLKNEKILRMKLTNHLTDIVRLLKSAKNIIGASITEKDLIPIQVGKIESIILNKNTEKKLNSFILETKKTINDYAYETVELFNKKSSSTELESKNTIKCINKLVDITVAWAELQKMKIENRIEEEEYNQQYSLLCNEMSISINKIEDKNNAILEVVSQLENEINFDKIEAMELISQLVNSSDSIEGAIEIKNYVSGFIKGEIETLII